MKTKSALFVAAVLGLLGTPSASSGEAPGMPATGKGASYELDKRAAAEAVCGFEKAVQDYDFDRADSYLTPDTQWIEGSFRFPIEPFLREVLGKFRDARIRIAFHPTDVVAEVNGDVAWVTLILNSTWQAETGAGKAILGAEGEVRIFYVETHLLTRTEAGWKIILGNTTDLPAQRFADYLGLTVPPYIEDRGGVRLTSLKDGSLLSKAGFKAGDLVIALDGKSVDSFLDLCRDMPTRGRAGAITLIAMRGQEKIARQVMLPPS